jgi:alpha-L-rhamnosidase
MINTEFPGWGYSIVNGATTIWERWDSYTEKDGNYYFELIEYV